MSPSEIKTVAESFRLAHPELKHVDLEAILKNSISESGMGRFLGGFRKPTAWLSAFIGLYIDGLLPGDNLIKFLSGLTIGAAIEWASNLVKSEPETQLPSQEHLVWPNLAGSLNEAVTKDVAKNLVAVTVESLSRQGFVPTPVPALNDEDAMQTAYRVASRNPRFKALVV